MRKALFHIVLIASALVVAEGTLCGQEVLKAARVQARANRKHLPALGLPVRTYGNVDHAVWYFAGKWRGADSLKDVPLWTMEKIAAETINDNALPSPVVELCLKWSSEKPKVLVDLVWGPFRDGWFVAICKRTRSDLGWKSIGFVIPAEGMLAGKRIWDYSRSVNWIENQIGYNLFPKLPSHLQEIIEEMTSAELLCPFSEFDPGLDEGPDREIDYDWEEDYREMG